MASSGMDHSIHHVEYSLLDSDHKAPSSCKQHHHLHLDDSTSTAAPSALHSPLGGPEECAPQVHHMNHDALTPALASLGHCEAESSCSESLPSPHLQQIQRRLEGYFSAENLCADQWLRSHMDRFGWVPLADVLCLPGLLGASETTALTALQHSQLVQISGDFRRVRPFNPAIWAAFAPRPEEEADSSESPSSQVVEVDQFVPDADVADEDLPIAVHLEPSDQEEFPTQTDQKKDVSKVSMLQRTLSEDSTHAGSEMEAHEPVRASREGAGWPCVEWLTSDPQVDESLLGWLSDTVTAEIEDGWKAKEKAPTRHSHHRRHRHHRQHSFQRTGEAAHPEFNPWSLESDAVDGAESAWLRFSDDGYAVPAAALMQW